MIAFTDVHYADTSALAACVVASDWADVKPFTSVTARVSPIAEYEPGAFYKRELPCLLTVLERAPKFTHVVIDGYVWLDNAHTPGLGAHLYEALGRSTPVIGVAKTAFRGSEMALRLARPGTEKPLFVTSIGLEAQVALQHLQRLHGPYRIPTMLKRVDQLSRGG